MTYEIVFRRYLHNEAAILEELQEGSSKVKLQKVNHINFSKRDIGKTIDKQQEEQS